MFELCATVSYTKLVLVCRQGLQWERKLWHGIAGVGVYAPYALGWLSRWQMVVFLLLVLVFWFGVETLRFRWEPLNKALLGWFGFCFKEQERYQYTSVGFFISGVLLVSALFPRWIADVAVLCLIVGDPMAYFVGKTAGKRPLGNGKTWEGFLGCVLGCSAVVAVYLLANDRPLYWALAAGVSAGFLELKNIRGIDDNFQITTGVALVLAILAGPN